MGGDEKGHLVILSKPLTFPERGESTPCRWLAQDQTAGDKSELGRQAPCLITSPRHALPDWISLLQRGCHWSHAFVNLLIKEALEKSASPQGRKVNYRQDHKTHSAALKSSRVINYLRQSVFSKFLFNAYEKSCVHRTRSLFIYECLHKLDFKLINTPHTPPSPSFSCFPKSPVDFGSGRRPCAWPSESSLLMPVLLSELPGQAASSGPWQQEL